MWFLQVDAVSILPSAYRDEDGELIHVVDGVDKAGRKCKKVCTYLYSFLLVPTHPDLKPRFVCGLLSTQGLSDAKVLKIIDKIYDAA